MSTFNGEIAEISGISVDNFSLNVECFFLSHCHTDHMKGLDKLKTAKPIYATAISALIIRRKYPYLAENLVVLDNGIPREVKLSDDQNFVVTSLSAGHCAGACMFLFQIESCDILYTGDFRISLKDAQNIKAFDEIQNHNAVVYLDSTFMKKSYLMFPSQTESIKTILQIVNDFMKKSKIHKVHIKVPARYGYEYLLMELNAKLNEKICVNFDIYNQYTTISLLESCVTMNQDKSRIFLKAVSETDIEDQNILTLQLSAMFWSKWSPDRPFVKKITKNYYRVLYSTHCSFNEIRDFILFLKPKKVHLNVLPPHGKEREEMFDELCRIQNSIMPKDEIDIQEVNEKATAENADKKFTFKRLRSKLSNQNKASVVVKKFKEI